MAADEGASILTSRPVGGAQRSFTELSDKLRSMREYAGKNLPGSVTRQTIYILMP